MHFTRLETTFGMSVLQSLFIKQIPHLKPSSTQQASRFKLSHAKCSARLCEQVHTKNKHTRVRHWFHGRRRSNAASLYAVICENSFTPMNLVHSVMRRASVNISFLA